MSEPTKPNQLTAPQGISKYLGSGAIHRFFSILISLELYLFVISTSLAVTLLVIFYRYSYQSFDLLQFHHRAIGGAVMEAKDSAQRSELFYVLLMVASFTFSLMFSSTTALVHLLTQQNLLFKTRVERVAIIHSALLTIPCLIMTALRVNSNLSLKILIGIAFSSVLLIGCKIVLSLFHSRAAIRLLCRYRLIVSMIFSFSSCYFGLAYLLDYNPPLIGLHNIVIIVIVYATGLKRQKFKTKHFTHASLPLTLIPLALPFSCEIQYWLTKYYIVGENIVYATMILFLALTAAYLSNRKHVWFYSHRIIRNLVFPIFLTTLITFYNWDADFIFSLGNDLLHPGNFLLPAQMFIGHGLLPFIEFWPDLGLQSTLPASLYTIIFGVQGLDGLIYHFLPQLVGGIALYFILCCYFPANWALMCSIFLPLAISPDWIANSPRFYFPNRVSYALVVILCFGWVMKSFTTMRLILLWLIALLSFAWMPSTGKTVIQCLFILLALRSLQEPWNNIQMVIRSFLIVFVPAFALYFLLLVINGFNPIDSVQSLLSYNIAERYILSYPTIIRGKISGLALWYYGICPFLLLGITGLILFRQIRGLQISSRQWILTALAIFTVFAGLRALNRHCLIETYNPVFAIVLASLLPILFIRNRYWCTIWATIIFSVAALLMPRPTKLPDALHVTSKHWSTVRPNRVIVNDQQRIMVLTDFLKQHLGKDQTYLEFIHGHLLYVLSGHAAPPFHKFARVLSSERAQQLYLKQAAEYLVQDKIPLVILDGPFWGSKVDNIASLLALFRISEFLNDNYSPFAEVNGFTILKANNSTISLKPQAERTLTSIRFKEGQSYQVSEAKYNVKKDLLVVVSNGVDPHLSNLLAYAHHPVMLNENRKYYFRIRMRGDITGELQAYLSVGEDGYSEKMSAKIGLDTTMEIKEYLIPLPLQRTDNKLTGLRIDPPSNGQLFIEKIDLVESLPDEVVAKQISKVTQTYSMSKLPYVWANFDEHQQWKSGIILFTDQKELILKPQQEKFLVLPSKIDKTRGNYLSFRIKSQHTGKVKLTYGYDLQSSISFDLIASEQGEEYVIRLSSQWTWVNEDVRKIVIVCDTNAIVQSFSILSAD